MLSRRRFTHPVVAALSVLALSVLALAAIGLGVPTAAAAAATGTQWIGSGPGTTTVVSDGTTVAPKFSYHQASNGPSTWTFSTIATAAATVTLPYDDSGFYAYFQVQASLSSFVTHLGSTTSTSLVSAGPVNCCSAPSAGFNYTGSVTFTVAAGDIYGFTFGGSNSDSNNTLQGTLDLGTPQTITFTQPANTPLGVRNVIPAATASSGLTPTFTSSTPTVCTVVNGAAHLVGLGTCTLVADQAGNLIYDPASSVTRSFTVGKAAPTVSAQGSAGGAVGTAISDTLSLAGAFLPTGTVVFTLYGPNDTTCTTTPVFTSTVAINGGGPYQSAAFIPAAVGTYRWIASYSGDPNNLAATGACADAGQVDSLSLAATGPAQSEKLTILGLLLVGLGISTLLVGRRRSAHAANSPLDRG